VLIHRGRVREDDVPVPLVEPGGVLVEVAGSLISMSTELTHIQRSGQPPIWKVLEQLKRSVDCLARKGQFIRRLWALRKRVTCRNGSK